MPGFLDSQLHNQIVKLLQSLIDFHDLLGRFDDRRQCHRNVPPVRRFLHRMRRVVRMSQFFSDYYDYSSYKTFRVPPDRFERVLAREFMVRLKRLK